MLEGLSHSREEAWRLRKDHQALHKVHRLPNLYGLRSLASLLHLLQVRNRWRLVLQLVELDELVLLRYVLRDAVPNKSQLEGRALPLLREQTLQWEHDVLRLASNEQLHQSLELLRVEAMLKDIRRYVLVDDLAERLENFLPAQV